MFNITKEQFFNFIKTKKDVFQSHNSYTKHYLNYFDRYQRNSKKFNLNWSAILGPLWFFYRKMYAAGFTICCLDLILFKIGNKFVGDIFIIGVQEGHLMIDAFFSIGVALICICFGDYIYLEHASRKIAKGKNESGVNLFLPIIFVVLYLTTIVFSLIWDEKDQIKPVELPHQFLSGKVEGNIF